MDGTQDNSGPFPARSPLWYNNARTAYSGIVASPTRPEVISLISVTNSSFARGYEDSKQKSLPLSSQRSGVKPAGAAAARTPIDLSSSARYPP